MNNKKIIFMSRLDFDCALGAHLLCEIATKLKNRYNDIEILIIGGGSEYKSIFEKANKINATAVNGKLIFMLGNIANPSVYFEPGALFVGVSRSALEAMAHGLPVILLGNEGYLGLFDKSKIEYAKKTNFTCRGTPKLCSSNTLFNEICRYFDMSEQEKANLSELSRKTVKDNYSATKMANETLEFYKETISIYRKKQSVGQANHEKPIKIAICGYYGKGNLGDEAILSQIVSKIKSTTISKCNGGKPRNVKIHVIKSKSPIKILSAMSGADLFIFGGGSLLQNSTSDASLFYYLFLIFLSDILCKRKIMLANGIGPIETSILPKGEMKLITASAIDKFDLISVRDRDSQKLIQEWLPKRKIRYVCDPALAYFAKAPNNINQQLIFEKTKKSTHANKAFIYIPHQRILNKAQISAKRIATSFVSACENFGAAPIVAVLNREDLALAQKMQNFSPKIKVVKPENTQQLISLIKNARLCITQRYHGALFSLPNEIPTLILSNDPKLIGLCKELNLPTPQEISIIGETKALNRAIINTHNFFSRSASRISDTLIARAKRTDKLIAKIFSHYI